MFILNKINNIMSKYIEHKIGDVLYIRNSKT